MSPRGVMVPAPRGGRVADNVHRGSSAGAGADRWYRADRLAGLRRFALAITILNVLGHTVLGFEPSWAQPVVGVLAAYATEILLELVDARAHARAPRFAGGPRALVEFLLPAHISGLAVSMLLYSNERAMPIVFAAALAVASKSVLRVRIGQGERHVFNPSNLGIAVTLLLFPWVGIAPPYMFTENLGPRGDWVFPAVIVVLGTLLNARYTRRLPLITAWLAVFVLQGFVRHAFLGVELVAPFLPMTGMAFLLFTFYMVTDPPTTPSRPRAQLVFGAAVAVVYGLLMVAHVVFGLFFALAITSSVRALWLWSRAHRSATAHATITSADERAAPAFPGAIPVAARAEALSAVQSTAPLPADDPAQPAAPRG